MKYTKAILAFLFLLNSCGNKIDTSIGQTIITKWQGDKKAAISITYDDGIINQFTVAKPIMDTLGLPGTFFIITGKVAGSGQGKFLGRPEKEIIKETATLETNRENFFERASLIGFTGTTEAVDYHSRVGSFFEAGKLPEAYKLLDEAYRKLRKGTLRDTDEVVFHDNPVDTTTWKQYKVYTQQGHEIASHTVTHPRLAVLDEANLVYELEQSKADIEKYLGKKYTFSAEGPYGTENERVMEYAHRIYPALRNRMPAPYMDELNRSSEERPEESKKEYVQWQRGPVNSVSMEKMKAWVATCLGQDNIWLVLVFHGINGIGWEPRTAAELEDYFRYMKEREPNLWIATFADVTKYIRERKNSRINAVKTDATIVVHLTSELDAEIYDVPMTLKTYVPDTWKATTLYKHASPKDVLELEIQKDTVGFFVLYPYTLGEGEIRLRDQTGN